MRRIILASFCAMLVAAAVRAQDAADLARGIELYTKADYKTAIAVLDAMNETKLRKDEQVTRHKFLALSLIGRKERGRAQDEFIKLLEIEPDYELSDKEVSPPVLELFKQSKIAQGGRVCERAVEEYSSGQFREAIPDFKLVLRLSPNDTRAREFLRLAENRVKEEEEEERKRREEEEKVKGKCSPVRAWGELDATNVTCQGIDYSSRLQLPLQANRVTLIYSKYHFGVGACWKIVLYDPEGKEVFVFDDSNQEFGGKQKPSQEKRWRVVDLPEIRTIARVVMHGQGGHDFGKLMGRVGKDVADEFILGLEVVCPTISDEKARESVR